MQMPFFISKECMVRIVLNLILLLFTHNSYANTALHVLSGYVEDIQSGERLIAASIFHIESSTGTTSNSYGFFSLALPYGKSQISVSYIGYQNKLLDIDIRKDTAIIIGLEMDLLEIDELTIVKKRGLNIEDNANHLQLDINKVTRLPVIFGEKDILKAYQLLPGVQSGIEGTAGMVIRGSDPGQNLILLDGVPVYNVNHLFGLFSVFNTDAIKSTSLLKGDFPARFGGRIASVLDIRLKEGNIQETRGNVSIGLISVRAMIEGPIKKNKTSYLVSVRRSYIDLFAYPYFKWILNDEAIWTYKFYDLNLKLNHIFNERNRVYVSYYFGQDKYLFKNEEISINTSSNEQTIFEEKHGFNWGNHTGTLRWNHQFSKKLFSNTTFILSKYRFQTESAMEETVLGAGNNYSSYSKQFYSGIEDIGASIDFDYSPSNKHTIMFGGTIVKHNFYPGVNIRDFSDFEGLLQFDSLNTGELLTNIEIASYFEDKISITDKLSAHLGLRYSLFQADERAYHILEPRISIKLKPLEHHTISLAYSRTSQPIHLLVNSSVGFPSDQWVPVTDQIKPIIGNQFNISYHFDFLMDFSGTLSSFYKTMENVLEFKDNADRKLNWQEIVEQGKGTAYGIEILVERKIGKTTGWIAYTLSKSDRIFDSINEGRSFPYKYDRRNDIKLVIIHQFSKRMDISMNWIYNTGYAVTLPLEVYTKDNTTKFFNGYHYPPEILNYDEKNGFRMPSYHRLDLSINFHKQRKHYYRTLTFGIYNTYMHRNAFYYDFYQGKLRSNSVIPIMPSVNYSLKF